MVMIYSIYTIYHSLLNIIKLHLLKGISLISNYLDYEYMVSFSRIKPF